MFSKKLTIVAGAALLIAGLAGCDHFLKSSQNTEEQERQDTIFISNKSLECLDGLADHMQSFLDDRADTAEVESIYTCLEKSVNTFTLYTKGSDPDAYTGEEMRHFFNRYFLKRNQISEDFMAEILKLKAFAVGGSTTTVSRAEIEQLLGFARLLGDTAQDLRGQMRVLLARDSKAAVSAEQLESLRGRVQGWVVKFVARAKFAGSMYEFADFNEFMKELHGFLNANPDFERVQGYIPLAQAVKSLVIGERSDLRTQRDWQNVMSWGADAYFLGLTGYYRMRNWDYNSIDTSRELVDAAERALSLVERSPVFRSLGRLDAAAIDRVIDELKAKDLFMQSVSAEILKASYRRLIQRVFDRNNALDARLEDVTGLEKKHLGLLHFELRAWQLSQESLTVAFEKSGPAAKQGLTPAQLLGGANAIDVAAKIRGYRDVTDARALMQTWKDWLSVLSQPRTLQWTESGRLLMGQRADQVKSSLKGLTVMNALRPAVRLLMRGYGQGDSPDLWALQLQEADLVRLEKEFHEFAVAVKFIDTRSANPAARTFKEASFFSYSGNGDEWLTTQEIYEELNTLMAVGGGVSQDTFHGAIAKSGGGCALPGKDIFGLEKVDEPCFEKYLRANFAKFMEGVPMLVAEVARMDETQWHEFYTNFMTVAAVPDKKTGITEFSEIRTALVTLHYVEGLIQIYDGNHDDRLQQAEIVASTPRFRSFIASQSPLGQTMVDTIFLFIVYRGHKPSAGDIFRMPAFQIELANGMRDIGRQELLKVLAVLKEDASK